MSLKLSIHSTDESLRESEIHRAVAALAARADEIKQANALPQGAGLDITYVITDKASQQSESISIQGYDSKKRVLSFEVTVPGDIIDSPQAPHFAATALLDVIDHALLYFKNTYETHGIRFKSIQWHSALIPLFQIGRGASSRGVAHA